MSLLVAALMAWYGLGLVEGGDSYVLFFGYWGLFSFLLFLSLYMALLDYRYIRLQYRLAEREAFKSTLGSHEFRGALQEAHDEKNGVSSAENHKE